MKTRRGYSDQPYVADTDDVETKSGDGGAMPYRPSDTSMDSAPYAAAANSPGTENAGPAYEHNATQSGLTSIPSTAGDGAGVGSPASQPAPGPGASEAPATGPSIAAEVPATGGPAANPMEAAAYEVSSPASGGGSSAAAPSTGGGGYAPAAESSSGSFLADDMGWDMAAFAEAGGFEAVLTGQLPVPGGDDQDIFIFAEELNLDIINNTLIQNTEVNIIADDGSVIDIDGDIITAPTQEVSIVDGPGASFGGGFGGGPGLPGSGQAPPMPQDGVSMPGDAPVADDMCFA